MSHLLDGYNCTLFAYGQTGSGKSYSLMERGVNKGKHFMVLLNISILTSFDNTLTLQKPFSFKGMMRAFLLSNIFLSKS